MTMPEHFWKSKLAAFLHDPPHKQFDIAKHDEARGVILRYMGLSEEEMLKWWKSPDWWASAADRYPFPRSNKLYVDWSSDSQFEFHHPLAGTRFSPKDRPRAHSHIGEKWMKESLHGLSFDGADDKARVFGLWRFWAERAAREKNDILAYLPADSRIPDHTIWQHNALCSALDATDGKPAFLMMQIGPVQEFIAQSKKMQDLWSGSYLLSYLISKAVAAIALEIGPEAVIYPSLRGVPLLDWAWSKEAGLFPEGTFEMGKGRLHPNELLIPSLPNRFLALVPAGSEGLRIATIAKKAITDEWMKIAAAVHKDICTKMGEHLKDTAFFDWDNVWQDQVSRFPVIDYILHDWSTESSKQAEKGAPPLTGGWENHSITHADQWREIVRGFGDSKHSGINLGSHWALHYAMVDWKFAAAKNARSFKPWSLPLPSHKDHLNGRDEVLGGSNSDAFWIALRDAYKGEERGDFKGQQRYGAMTVIKRLWARCYLRDDLKWPQHCPRFESVPEIATLEKAIDSEEDAEKYYAILCMDGDDMGQWVSGAKAPALTKALADKSAVLFREHWKHATAKADDVLRPLSPSYHAALSESLNHFSLYAAGQVVEKFGGQLFYAGGDDVLAILPAQNALDCAIALKCAFQGHVPEDASTNIKSKLSELFEFPVKKGGFLCCIDNAGRSERLRPNWPLIVPGPTASVSVGIAIGHVRSPMQEVIQAAREAESVAKKVPNKGAYCLRVMKRSGESAEFAARFTSGVCGVWDELSAGVHNFSGRFPYRYLHLIKPLLARSGNDANEGWEKEWTSTLIESCLAELRHVLINQAKQKADKATITAERWINHLIDNAAEPVLSPAAFLHFWMAWAFVNRITTEDK